jgi:hypothetical protein
MFVAKMAIIHRKMFEKIDNHPKEYLAKPDMKYKTLDKSF